MKRKGIVPTGSAMLSGAGSLPCQHVIHAVGPIWQDGTSGEEDQLVVCVQQTLSIAKSHNIRSIAIPAISSGIFGVPLPVSARAILRAVQEFVSSGQTVVKVGLHSICNNPYSDELCFN